VHVDVEDVVPLFGRYLDRGPVVADAGVVDQDVHRPETLRHLLYHPVHLRAVGNVEVNRDSCAARVRNFLGDPLGAFTGTGGQGDAGAGLDEGPREGFAKARVAPGHDGSLARQVESVENGHRTSPLWCST
jgi:hypothetical protein